MGFSEKVEKEKENAEVERLVDEAEEGKISNGNDGNVCMCQT